VSAVQTSPPATSRTAPIDGSPEGTNLELVEPAFSLTGEINRLIDEGRLVDPREIASAVFDAIPREHTDAILRQLLIYAVRHTIHGRRQTQVTKSNGSSPGSARWEQAAQSLERKLNTQVWTANGWKRHRDCTIDDLMSVVQHHEAIASQNAATAECYDRQVKAMKKAKAKVFGDLPASQLEDLL
jgi:hypothetical protein